MLGKVQLAIYLAESLGIAAILIQDSNCVPFKLHIYEIVVKNASVARGLETHGD